MNTKTYLTEHIPNLSQKWNLYKKGLGDLKITDWVIASDYVNDKNKPRCLVTFSIFPKSVINRIIQEMREYVPTDIKHITNISEKTLDYLKKTHNFFTFSIALKNKKQLCNTILRDNISKLIEVYKLQNENEKKIFHDKYVKLQKLNQYLNQNNCSKEKIGLMMYVAKFLSYILEFLLIKEKGINPIWLSDRDDILNIADGIIYDFVIEFTEERVCSRIKNYNLNALNIQEEDRKDFDTLIRFPDIISGTLSSLYQRGTNLAYEKEKHKELFSKVIMSNPRLILLDSELLDLNKEKVRLIAYFKPES